MDERQETIALTGATGTVGAELVRILSRREARVRALTRRPREQPALTGVEWLAADLAEPEILAERLDGVDRLFLLTGSSADLVRLQTNALEAAGRAGVRHVVKLSAASASDHSKSVLGLWHYIVERRLRASGLAWTLLRPHHFMQNLLEPLVFDPRAGQLRSASGEAAIAFVDARDIASVAATVLTEPGHESEAYTVTGLRARSYREAAEILSRVLDRPLEYHGESLDEAWRRRRRAGQAAWRTAAHLAMACYHRDEPAAARTTDTVQRLTGRLPRTLHQFAEDHIEALLPSSRPDLGVGGRGRAETTGKENHLV